MSEGIATSLPVTNPAPEVSKPSPDIINSGFLIPDEAFALLDIYDTRMTTNSGVRDKVKNILNYFGEKTNSGDLGDIFHEIQQEFQKFGQPRLGSSRLEQLYHFVTIQRQIGQLEKRRKALFNG